MLAREDFSGGPRHELTLPGGYGKLRKHKCQSSVDMEAGDELKIDN